MSRTPVRRRSSKASARFASRAWSGQPVGALPGAEHEIGAPSSTGAATASEIGAAKRAVAVHEAHDVARRGATSPAQHAAPKPRRGSSTTRAPSARAIAPEPSVEPLSTTIGVHSGGRPASTSGSARASSSTGSTTSNVRVSVMRSTVTTRRSDARVCCLRSAKLCASRGRRRPSARRYPRARDDHRTVRDAPRATLRPRRGRAPRRPRRGPAIALGVWLALVAVAVVWGEHVVAVGDRLRIHAPPLAGDYRDADRRDRSLVPIAVARAASSRSGRALAAGCAGRRLLVRSRWSPRSCWAIALGLNDGWSGLTDPLLPEPVPADGAAGRRPARRSSRGFTDRSRHLQHPHPGPSAGDGAHPLGLDRLGLGGTGSEPRRSCSPAARRRSPPRSSRSARSRAKPRRARAAPFLVLAPAAIWWSSGDAFFAGVSAWAVTLVDPRHRARTDAARDRLALGGGLLFGVTRDALVRPRPARGDPDRRRRSPGGASGRSSSPRSAPALVRPGVPRRRVLVVRRARRDPRRSTGPASRAAGRTRTSWSATSPRSRWRSARPPRSGSRACATGGSGCSSAVRSSRSRSPTSAGCRRPRSSGSGCRSCRGCCSRRPRSSVRTPRPADPGPDSGSAARPRSRSSIEAAVRSPW